MTTLHPFAINTRVVRTTSGDSCGYIGIVIDQDGDRVRVQWDATHCHPKGVKTWVKFTEVDFETEVLVADCNTRRAEFLQRRAAKWSKPRFSYR